MHDKISALINRDYEKKPNYIQEEHEIKIDVLIDAYESNTF